MFIWKVQVSNLESWIQNEYTASICRFTTLRRKKDFTASDFLIPNTQTLLYFGSVDKFQINYKMRKVKLNTFIFTFESKIKYIYVVNKYKIFIYNIILKLNFYDTLITAWYRVINYHKNIYCKQEICGSKLFFDERNYFPNIFPTFSFMLEDIYFYLSLLQDIMFDQRVSRHLFLKPVELNHV